MTLRGGYQAARRGAGGSEQYGGARGRAVWAQGMPLLAAAGA